MKKVGKTTRPFRYDLNQIPYDYTLEVTNRFKGLDLIDRVPEELWSEVPDIVHEAVINAIPRKINAKGQNDCLRRLYKQLRREAKGKGEKERYSHLNAEFQRIARREKKVFSSEPLCLSCPYIFLIVFYIYLCV